VSENRAEKRLGRRDELRERLLAVAERTISARGLSGLKAREIAAKAGCAVGAIYNAFDDLDELIMRVNSRTLALLEAALAAVPETDEAQELLRLARAYLAFARTQEPRWRALFEHRLPAGREVPSWYVEDRNRVFSLLEEPLTRLLPGKDPGARSLLARTLFSAVHGIVSLGLEGKLGSAETLDAQLEDFVGAVAAGLRVA
jgi:AcrR family transcriptional regulator